MQLLVMQGRDSLLCYRQPVLARLGPGGRLGPPSPGDMYRQYSRDRVTRASKRRILPDRRLRLGQKINVSKFIDM